MKIVIISSSIRNGRLSHRVSLFLREHLLSKAIDVEILDLKEYNFPLFNERLFALENPSAEVLQFANKFTEADGVIIVSPVYNASFPAALKNVIDLFVEEWITKPVGIASVTYGSNAGIKTSQELQALLLKLGARVAAPTYNVINAGSDFSESGTPANKDNAIRFSEAMINELLWLIEKTKE